MLCTLLHSTFYTPIQLVLKISFPWKQIKLFFQNLAIKFNMLKVWSSSINKILRRLNLFTRSTHFAYMMNILQCNNLVSKILHTLLVSSSLSTVIKSNSLTSDIALKILFPMKTNQAFLSNLTLKFNMLKVWSSSVNKILRPLNLFTRSTHFACMRNISKNIAYIACLLYLINCCKTQLPHFRCRSKTFLSHKNKSHFSFKIWRLKWHAQSLIV